MITDEMIFYGGLAISAVTLVSGIICLLLLKMKRIRLDAQFDAEYGIDTRDNMEDKA